MNAPMLTSVLFSIILLMLPSYSPNLFNATLILIISIGFFIPLAFRSSIIRSASDYFTAHHATGKKFIALQSLVFLLFVQIIALLCCLDYFLSQFVGDAHNVLLIGIIVIAGLTAVIGRESILQTIYSTSSVLLIVGLLVLLINRLFFHVPLFSFFNPSLFQYQENSSFVNAINTNVFVSVAALSMIIFWLMWLEVSELHRKQQMPSNPGLLRSVISSGVFLVGVFTVFAQDIVAAEYSTVIDGNPLNMFIAFSLFAGLIGLFVSIFASVGVLTSTTVFPLFTTTVGPEKESLVNKLSTVFSVILAILLIPVVRNSGGVIVSWYIQFLAIFSAPVVVSYIIWQVSKHHHPIILSASIVLGTMYAIVAFVLHALFGIELFVDAKNVFIVTVSSGGATAVSYIFLERVSELITVKKIISRIGNSSLR